MTFPSTVSEQMRSDWDRRARKDACYYAAFGRLRQSREEFFDSAADVLRILREEFRRFPPGTDFKQLSALEIGCGPGRLMLPLSEVFGHISGVDVSGEMIALAKENLARVDHADVRTGMVPVRLRVLGRPASNTALMRVAPPGPLVPRLVRVSDGTNLLSSVAIESRKIRVRLEEVDADSEAEVNSAFAADIDGHPVEQVEPYAVDPLTRLYEFNLTLPDHVGTGAHKLTIRLGRRTFPSVEIHVAQ